MTVDIVPIGKPRMTRAFWAPAAQRYFEWADDLREKLPGYALTGELELTFYIPMPPSWSKSRQLSMLGAPHQQKPDIDNLCKAFMDAFGEDKHVHRLVAEKFWSNVGMIDIGFNG